MSIWGDILKKFLLLFLFVPLLLLAYSDGDLDGISDKNDLCPHSSMLDIVDETGCAVEKLVAPPKDSSSKKSSFDVMVGANYSKVGRDKRETLDTSAQLDYYYRDWTFQLQSSNYEEGGVGDTTLGLYYQIHPSSALSLSLGSQLILPTYKSDFDNNNMDYKLSSSLNYHLNKISLSLGGSYRINNDDDIKESDYSIEYQNSHSFYMGMGSYLLPSLYSSLVVAQSKSIYREGDDIKTLSLYNHYTIDEHWFSRFGYSGGLNSSFSDQFFLNVGYYR